MIKEALLSGFRALDLTDQKGFVCGKILATLGVEVIKVEKPGGDPARAIPPFIDNIRHPEKSLYWMAFNTNKKSITLNLETKQGQELFKQLIPRVDFVIESFTPGYLDKIGLGYEVINKINPEVILTSITNFGQKGPYALYKGSELITSAMSGVMASTGDPDRAPIREGLETGYSLGNAAAALGTIIAHYHRSTTGEGQQVDVSIEEVSTNRLSVDLTLWEFDRRLVKRMGNKVRFGAALVKAIWQCKDGYICWTLVGGMIGAAANRALSRWMDDQIAYNPLKKITNWEELDMAAIKKEELDIYEKAISDFFMQRTKKEIAEEGLKRGINAAVVAGPDDLLENPQTKTRGYWTHMGNSQSGNEIIYPKHFFLTSETDNFVKHRAPLIGENNSEIFRDELGLSSFEIEKLKQAGAI